MSEEGYSGYENWETWNTSLWLSNDEGMYFTVIDIMENNPPEYSEPGKAYFADTASEEVKDYFEQLMDDDIIKDRISIHRVRWQEVLSGFIEGTKLEEIPAWIKWAKQVEDNPNGNYALWEN